MRDPILPFDFHLLDPNGEPVLLLGGAMDLKLKIRNTSPTALFLNPLQSGQHFTLRFRAGVLSKQNQIGMAEGGEQDWADVHARADEQRDVLVELRHKGGEWPVGKAFEVTLEGVRGDSARGTRATRVELKYEQIRYGDNAGALLDGHKYQQLVLSAMTQANPVFEAHFVGETGNVVLNVPNAGQPHDYSIKLRLTNTTEGQLTVTSSTKFHVLLAGGPKEVLGTLATSDELNAYHRKAHIGAPGIEHTRLEEPAGEPWTFQKPENVAGDIAIMSHGYLEIEIGHIRTEHPNGSSDVRVQWFNLGLPHGKQDGEVVVTLQKSPLVIVGNRVGIGTIPRPDMQLDSKTLREVKDEASHALRGVVGSSVQIEYRTLQYPPFLTWPCISWRLDTKLYWPGAGLVALPNFWDPGVEQSLRDLLRGWRGLESYLEHRVLGMGRGDFAIPIMPNKSLYTTLGSEFGLFFDNDPNRGWWREKAVFLARWDKDGVRLVDGSIHSCPLQDP